jgi:hypothetical protein
MGDLLHYKTKAAVRYIIVIVRLHAVCCLAGYNRYSGYGRRYGYGWGKK